MKSLRRAVIVVIFGGGTAVAAPSVTSPCDYALVEVRNTLRMAHNESGGSRFAIRSCSIVMGKQILPLHETRGRAFPNLRRLGFVVVPPTGVLRFAEFPAVMTNRLIELLRRGVPEHEFDCNLFAHALNGIATGFEVLSLRRWRFEPYSEARPPAPGDTILIGNDMSDVTHLAIHLGEGLYLSLFGTSGGLIVTDLPAMEVGFGGRALRLHRFARDADAPDQRATADASLRH